MGRQRNKVQWKVFSIVFLFSINVLGDSLNSSIKT